MDDSSASRMPTQADYLAEIRRRQDTSRQREQIGSIEASKERCRTLVGFIKEAWHVIEPSNPYVHGWHIDAVCEHLQAVSAGQIPRLLINIPPGTAKSLMVSVAWPSFEWGPGGMSTMRYLSTSYSDRYVARDSRRMRDLILSEWYQDRWPLRLLREGEVSFENEHKGWREGVPFKSLTGGRAHRVLVDDPHSSESAESEAERETASRIFRESLPTRLVEPATSAIIVIMQRLHVRDISALAIEAGYCHLMLPMEFEPDRKCYTSIGFEDPRTKEGELLFPERFPREVVDRDKRVMGSYATAGQFAQRPTVREGGLFKRSWFRPIGAAPVGTKWVRYWDLAATEEQLGSTAAYTVGVKLGRTPEGRFVIGDVARLRAEGHGVRRLLKDTAKDDGPYVEIGLPQDPGAAGKIVAQDMVRMLAGYIARAHIESGNKIQRAEPIAAQAEAGNVDMVIGDWNKDFLDEACLARGTKIVTLRGTIPIETVCSGDAVMTRIGWHQVLEARCTNERAVLCQIQFSNGSALCCTLDHPILVPGCNFKKAGQLTVGDRLLRFIGGSSLDSCSTVQNNIFAVWSTAGRLNFIGIFGFRSAARFRAGRKAIMSIMSTTISGIIASIISSVSQQESTLVGIESGRSRGKSLRMPASCAASSIQPRRALGPGRAPRNAGTATNISVAINTFIAAFAGTAAGPTRAKHARVNFAAWRAALKAQLAFLRKNVFSRRPVNGVKSSSSRLQAQGDFADDLVVSAIRMLPGRHPVYNLEVADAHEFVASGILVHNCDFPGGQFKDQVDALSGAFARLIGGGLFDKPEVELAMPAVRIQGIWPRVCAIEVTNSMFAAVWAAFDRTTQTMYVYDTYRAPKVSFAIHAEAMRKRGAWIPVLFDLESRRRSKEEGLRIGQHLGELGLDMFTITLDLDAGIVSVAEKISTSRLRVFETLPDWFAEYRTFKRDEKGELVDENNELLRCTALIAMSGEGLAITENRAASDARGYDPSDDERDRSSTGY